MILSWIRRLLHRPQHIPGNGEAAKRAYVASALKRAEAQRLWPRTEQAREHLAELIENALRGNR